jgi:hypothetical protein
MPDDLWQTLLYIIIGLVGVIASAYRNKQKKSMTGPVPPVMRTPRGQERDLEPDPDLGPFMDLFNIPRTPEPEPEPVTVESGPSVEEGGLQMDTQEASIEMAGIKQAEEARFTQDVPVEESFEEGQSDIQKLIAKYDAIRKELEGEYGEDDIASGEIVSVEASEAARLAMPPRERIFDLRKAIIYSEILKRKEY